MNAIDFLFFITGSRQGSRACGIVTIINDEMTELSEDFTLNLMSQNQIATIEPTQSQLTVLIDDDDCKIKKLFVMIKKDFNSKHIFLFCLVLSIGFQDSGSSVPESAGDAFICVEVINVIMLAEDMEVHVFLSGGTAEGLEASQGIYC